MCFGKLENTENRRFRPVCVVVLFVIILFCIIRVRGKTLEQSTYSDEYGEIKVKEIETRPVSLKGLFGIGEKIYRCEFRKSPGGILESAISLHEDSYEAQHVKVSWNSARKATVSFDDSIFYEIEDGVWKRSFNLSNEKLSW